MTKQFGGKVTKELTERYSKSENWKEGKFENLEETSMNFSFSNMPKMLYKQFFETKGRNPKKKLPIEKFDKEAFLKPSKEAKLIWYGHSVVLMRINNQTLLIDPMLGENASPIAPFKTKRFSKGTLDLIDNFPIIDLMLMTHDHYDHLDLDSIKKLKSKVKHFYVALGVGRHLIKWGINEEAISEFDWWDKKKFEGIDIHLTPSRHFSGRGLKDRFKSLWGGWVFKTSNENIWFSGDGGYGKHFKEVGEKLGPFDFAFMECGQYNENWHQIHMFPEESVQAGKDGNAKKIMPVHWAGFCLSQHTWTDPVERFVKAADKEKIEVLTPRIGELFTVKSAASDKWWKDFS